MYLQLPALEIIGKKNGNNSFQRGALCVVVHDSQVLKSINPVGVHDSQVLKSINKQTPKVSKATAYSNQHTPTREYVLMSQIAHAKSSFTACIVQPFNFSTGLQVKPSVKTSDSLSLCTKHIARVGPNRILDRIYTVLLQGFSEIYGVYIRFQPTLGIWHLRWCMMLWVWQFGSVTGEVLVSELKLHKWSRDKLLVSELKLHKWPRDKLLHT